MAEGEGRSKFITQAWPPDHPERIRALQEAAGSLPLYERYIAGEFREVWMAMAALGDAVWLDPVSADALAVCYETMHRAKTNIKIIRGFEQDSPKKSPKQKLTGWLRRRSKPQAPAAPERRKDFGSSAFLFTPGLDQTDQSAR